MKKSYSDTNIKKKNESTNTNDKEIEKYKKDIEKLKEEISNLNKLRKYNMVNGIPSLNNDLINSLKFRYFFTKTNFF